MLTVICGLGSGIAQDVIIVINAVDDSLTEAIYTAASWQALQTAINAAIAQVNAATSVEAVNAVTVPTTSGLVRVYTLTLNASDGSVIPTSIKQAAGTTYTLPNPTRSGYSFTGWALSGGGSLNGNTYTFSASNGTVTAQWAENPATYLVTVNGGTGGGSYAAGAIVTISANAAPSGKVFDKWTTADGVTFTNVNAASTSFTMPAKSVTVTATYKDAPKPTPEKKYIFSTKYESTFGNWLLFFLGFGFIWMWF